MTANEPAEPEGVRIKAHPGLCLGFGNCHRWAPEVYPLDEDGKIDIHLLDVPPELAAKAIQGANVCPEGAITVIRSTPAPAHSPTDPPNPNGSPNGGSHEDGHDHPRHIAR